MIWKPIKGYEGIYEVSDTGLVRSLRDDTKNRTYSGKILKPGKTGAGYLFVLLSVNGITQNRMIHRLVAETFLPETGKNLEVNHIDGNKENNVVTNLEWCTRAYNLKHAVDNGLRYSQCNIIRGVTMITPDREKIDFKSMKDCCDYFGFSKCWLGNYIRKNGNPCTYKGYALTVHGRGGVTLS